MSPVCRAGEWSISFNTRLDAVQNGRNSLLCVGLDPDAGRPPIAGQGGDLRSLSERIAAFCCAAVDATRHLVCAYKPQIAHFAAHGAEDALVATIQHIRRVAPDVLVLLDAKRGDIGSTAERYAREAFERYDADAVTVNPYLGYEGLAPFLEHTERGVIVLCRTSNPGADAVQCWPASAPLYLRIAELAQNDWNRHDNVMLVTGATQPADLGLIRQRAPALPFLVPGIGAQGGDLAATLAGGLRPDGQGVVISSSRGVIYAPTSGSAGDSGLAAVSATAQALRDAINNQRAPLPAAIAGTQA